MRAAAAIAALVIGWPWSWLAVHEMVDEEMDSRCGVVRVHVSDPPSAYTEIRLCCPECPPCPWDSGWQGCREMLGALKIIELPSFHLCFQGPAKSRWRDCWPQWDADGDGDVDMRDYAILRRSDVANVVVCGRSYRLRVSHDLEHGGYTAQCVELPAAIDEGDTFGEAVANGIAAIASVLEFHGRADERPAAAGEGPD